jgi:hypothetical protein
MMSFYIDETGTADNQDYSGYGGILGTEKEKRKLIAYHEYLCGKYFPNANSKDVVFHAYEIFNGKGAFSEANGFSKKDQKELFYELLGFRKHADFWCVMNFHNKNEGIRKFDPPEYFPNVAGGRTEATKAITYLGLLELVETFAAGFLKQKIEIVAEEDDFFKRRFAIQFKSGKEMHKHFCTYGRPTFAAPYSCGPFRQIHSDLKLKKKNYIPLQFTDCLLFAFHRYWSQKSHSEVLLERVFPDDPTYRPKQLNKMMGTGIIFPPISDRPKFPVIIDSSGNIRPAK